MEKRKGSPPTKPAELKDGFYLELRNKGSNSAVKIRRDNMEEIEKTIKQYERVKIVTYLGQVVKGRYVDGKMKGKKTN